MRPLRVAVHNVRGALDVRLHLHPFSALIGPNNAGKTTLLDAVRLFYGSLDWDDRRDRPWNLGPGEASWVEIDYEVGADEADRVLLRTDEVELSAADRDEGITGLSLLDGDVLRIRRYLTDEPPYTAGAYYFVPPGGGDPLPTGWDEATGELGQCVYVPPFTQVRDQTSLSEPSPLRDVLLLAFSETKIDGLLLGAGGALSTLRKALNDGPIAELESELDEALRPWGLSAEVGVGELSGELIMRHLIELHLKQEGTRRAPEAQGSGVQRALIAALIQTAARLRSKAKENSFRWILFEEPEAFLHPAQVTRLAQDLRRLTRTGNAAVTITTHDPTTLSASETPPEGIARVQRHIGGRIVVVSPEPARVASALADIHTRSAYALASRSCFRTVRQTSVDEERHRVLYDLDARRAAAFFADQVIVVEGISDAVFFEWLDRRGFLSRLGPNVGVLDAGGKFELHRAATTLSLFGIPHVVLWDEDAAMPSSLDQLRHRRCQDAAALLALQASANQSDSAFVGAVRLAGTIEHWLGIAEEKAGAWKAANLGAALSDAYADQASPLPGRIDALLQLLKDLFDGASPASHRSRPEFSTALISRRLDPPAVDLAAEFAMLPRSACMCSMPHMPTRSTQP
jgi:putative ATP-dependent endonuclease of the OLD family